MIRVKKHTMAAKSQKKKKIKKKNSSHRDSGTRREWSKTTSESKEKYPNLSIVKPAYHFSESSASDGCSSEMDETET